MRERGKTNPHLSRTVGRTPADKQRYNTWSSLALLATLGLWLLLGVTAIVTRFWTYHMPYDDLLLLLPMTVLFRIAVAGPVTGVDNWVAGLLFGVTLLNTLAPGGRGLPWPRNVRYMAGQVCG